MKHYDRVIDEIAGKFDALCDVDRRKAFIACIEYADRELIDTVDYNYFMFLAGSRFGCDPVMKNVLRLVQSKGTEKVILRYTQEGGPSLSANRSGLEYLSKAFATLATSPLPGDHFHLRHMEFPMVGRSFPLTVFSDNDDWFETQLKSDGADDEEQVDIPMRPVVPEHVRAVVITERIPESMLLATGKVYGVTSVAKLVDQMVWTKNIREDGSRMYVFEIVNDDGKVTSFGLDLDDNGVVFISENDMGRIRSARASSERANARSETPNVGTRK